MAALASLGFSQIKVQYQPRIAVMSTGKELDSLECQQDGVSNGHICDSNSYYIKAAVKRWGYRDIERCTSVGDGPSDYDRRIVGRSTRTLRCVDLYWGSFERSTRLRSR